MVFWRAALILISVTLCALPEWLAAEPIAKLKPSGYVNDFAQVLSSESAAYLENLCTEADEKAKAQIAVVTIHSLDGRDVEGYAVDLYKSWGIGNKSTNRGVLILFATDDHRYRIEVGYGLEPILPDGKVGGFGREAVPLLKQGDFSGAVRLLMPVLRSTRKHHGLRRRKLNNQLAFHSASSLSQPWSSSCCYSPEWEDGCF